MHTDERGSIVAQADCSGNRTAVNTYDEFGIRGAWNTGRFRYTGQAWLSELGLYYYKARMYSPTYGRFMQADPIGYADGPNWYAYAGNDPVNAVDPSGLEAVIDGGTITVTGKLPGAIQIGGRTFQSDVKNQSEMILEALSRGLRVAVEKTASGQMNDPNSMMRCAWKATKKNAVALGLDVAGAIVPGSSTGTTLAKLAISASAMANAVATAD